MSDNEIKIKASVEDDASKEINKLGKTVNDTSKKIDATTKATKNLSASKKDLIERFRSVTINCTALGVALGNIAFNVAANAAKNLGKQIVNAFSSFAESEKVTNRLTAALKNQGIYSGYLLKDYENFAKEMRNYSGVADDVIKDNMTLLTNYGLMGDELKKATKAAMTLSVGLGTDLKSATMMLAKAAEGNITTFQRYGINIKSTGDKAKDFQQILKGVEDKFGDLAKVNADNLSTQVAVLKENWEDLKKELVSGVVPAINSVLKAFNELFKARDVKKENQYVADLFEKQLSYQKTLALHEENLARIRKRNANLRWWQAEMSTKYTENEIAKYNEEIAKITNLIKEHNNLKKSAKEENEQQIHNMQLRSKVETEAAKAKEKNEQKVFQEMQAIRHKAADDELEKQKTINQKKADLAISSQQNVLNNIADLNKSANDYELAEKINYYEQEYQSKIASLDRQIQAVQEKGKTETTEYALLIEQKKALDEEYQAFTEEKNKLIEEKGTALHDFNIWLTQDEVQKRIKSISELSKLQQSKIKEVAAIGKAAAIANTTVSTYHMAVEAYEAMAGIPVVGPGLGVAAAAAATAYGLEQIANIAGVQFASGTDYVTSDMIAQVHKGEIIVPRTFSDAIRSGDIALTSPTYHNFEEETTNNKSENNNQTIVLNLYVENNGQSVDELAKKIRDTIAEKIAFGTMRPFPTKERM